MSGANADFLIREAIGSPIEAAELGRPVNGPDGQGDVGSEIDGYPRDLAELHTRLVGWFEAAERASIEGRKRAERDSDYYHGFQWTAEEAKRLRARGQMPIVINYIKRKVEYARGQERKSRTDPKAYPRTPQEEGRANAATAVLRYVADANSMPVIASEVYEDVYVRGFGGCELRIEDDGRGGAEVAINHIPWDRLWHDAHSRFADFRDARHLGTVIWADQDELLEMFPNASEEVITDSFGPTAGSYDDRPGVVHWQDSKRTRCRVVQCHWQERGQWWCAAFSRAGFLEHPYPSAFRDRKGRSACPLILQSAYVDGENNRYGAVRDLIDPQDEINKRRSKALHLLTARTAITEKGAFEDEDRARREMSRPDGLVVVNPGFRFEIEPHGDLVSGQMQLLQHATLEMEASGPNASLSGSNSKDLSGRAIIANQQGGAVSNEPLADALRLWKQRVYESCWMAFREYCPGERWVRVTDDLNTVQFVGLNRQVTLADELASMPPDQMAMAQRQLMLMPGDPRLGMVVRRENDITDLEVDITVEEGADVPALQAEQFQQVVQLAGAFPGLFPPDVIIAMSNLKDKDKLLERLQQAQQAQAAGAAGQQQLQQAELRGKHAKASADEALAMERTQNAIGRVGDLHIAATGAPWVPVGPVGEPKEPEQARPQR